MRKIITRIKGGLGNQLFCYATARRLALVNNAELVIDNVTGFSRDVQYCRRYMLDHFCISARKATPAERLIPFERYRRGFIKWLSSKKPFEERKYLGQEGNEFDERLLTLKVKKTLYLDGYWQSEAYFKDVEQIIREDLRVNPPYDSENNSMAKKIRGVNSVAIHIRCFDLPHSTELHNVSVDYYQRAICVMESKIKSPHYFLFSDNVDVAREKVILPKGRVTCISHNAGDERAYADLWLMTHCRHFITANSTFSWWGAWLGGGKEKIVVTPDLKIGGVGGWSFKGLIPDEWVKL